MKRIALALIAVSLPAMAMAVTTQVGVKPPLAIDHSAKVMKCTEVLREMSPSGAPSDVPLYSNATIVDFGDMFLVRNEMAESFALSGSLDNKRDNIAGGYPQPGIFMGRGYGPSYGLYTYVSDRVVINWDCRR